jgi:pSer/pThr/pTyr-binding forkhead associated (FHA) protein
MSTRRRKDQTKLLGKQFAAPEPSPTPAFSRPTPAPTHILLQVGGPAGTVTTLGFEIKDRLLIGRVDMETNTAPDLDLTPFGAQDAGVSRRHAAILRLDGALFLQDLNSRNGTKLNGLVLETDHPHPLHDGDTFELGRLGITLRFVRSNF